MLFANKVVKYNEKLKGQSRTMVITESAVYNFSSGMFGQKVSRRIALSAIEKVSMSPYIDTFIVLHVSGEVHANPPLRPSPLHQPFYRHILFSLPFLISMHLRSSESSNNS